jgi:uncharacterized sulfatase
MNFKLHQKVAKLLFLPPLFLVMIGISACEQQGIQTATGSRPNILFIMSDDHTSQAIGAYGKRFAVLNPTPTIDRLAQEGMLFENVFCTNSICTPSRATIMTGQYSHVNGVLDLDGSLPRESHYLAIEMKRAGYQTAMIGKWHLKMEPVHFDYYKVLPGQGSYHNPDFHEKGVGTWPNNLVHTEGHSSDRITDATLDWLASRDKSKPFFLMHHYKAPHDMFENAPRYDDYMEDVEFPEPENMWRQPDWGSVATRGNNDSLISVIGSSIGKRNHIRNMGMHMKVDTNLSDEEYKHLAYKRYMRRYFRCVKGVDDNLKRLFSYLEENNLMDNTVIMYTGDQGFFLGEHDFIDKRWMYEEGMRMPFIVRYPEMIAAGSRNDWLINNTDFAPTILELAGVETPEYMQGSSFVSALKGENEPATWRQATYYRYWMHMAHNHNNPAHFGIRTKKYKLIFFYGTDWTDGSVFEKWKTRTRRKNAVAAGNRFWADTPAGWEFYDLEKDPDENKNEYHNSEYQDIIKNLKMQLRRKRENLNEIDDHYPKIEAIILANWDK